MFQCILAQELEEHLEVLTKFKTKPCLAHNLPDINENNIEKNNCFCYHDHEDKRRMPYINKI